MEIVFTFSVVILHEETAGFCALSLLEIIPLQKLLYVFLKYPVKNLCWRIGAWALATKALLYAQMLKHSTITQKTGRSKSSNDLTWHLIPRETYQLKCSSTYWHVTSYWGACSSQGFSHALRKIFKSDQWNYWTAALDALHHVPGLQM